ncbi:hypothetical protein INT43_002994 [Umbelopsis isabellina]|uniref:Xylanolytic transcriptional activator regulatory domain-containing protein n=1 Tax=Mortierella isabellina TaxID=91625 RepID=A0A8H7PP96_MORIS|nr:hypothetical protein INT43_002994 [Umbelopsis isabellina]
MYLHEAGHVGTLERRINRMEALLAAVDQHSEENSRGSPEQSSQSVTSSYTPHSDQQEEPVRASINNVARQNNLHTQKIPEEDLDLARFESVRYLGDLSAIKFLSKSFSLEDSMSSYLPGHHVERLGKDTFLCAANRVPDDPSDSNLQDYNTRSKWLKNYVGLDVTACDRLIALYFLNIHPIFPIVNKHTFLLRYRGQSKSYPSTIVFNAMLGAAARYLEISEHTSIPNTKDHRALSDVLFERVLKEVFLQSVSGPSLPMVQAIILLLNHHATLDSKGSECYLLSGIAIRMAQDLGLHQSCEEWTMPEAEKQTRKRIWWSLYIMDRFNSALFGKPLSIIDEDCDVSLPDENAPWREIADTYPKSADSRNNAVFPSMADTQNQKYEPKEDRPLYQMFLQLAKLSEIIGQILQGLYTTRAKQQSYIQGSDNLVTRLDHELTIWRFGLIKVLQETDTTQQNELNLTPVAESYKQGKPNPLSSYSSFRICTSAAERSLGLACNLSPSDFLRFSWHFNLYSVLHSGLMCVYNAKNPDARISTRAKSDLAKCVGLLKRVRNMSASAMKIDSLVHNMMKLQEVDITGYDSSEDSSAGDEVNETKHKKVAKLLNNVPTAAKSEPPVVDTIMESNRDQEMSQPSFQMDNVALNLLPNIGQNGAFDTDEAFTLKQFGLSKDNDFSYLKALDSITGDNDIWSSDGSSNQKPSLPDVSMPWNIDKNSNQVSSSIFQSGYLMSGIPSKPVGYAEEFPNLLSGGIPTGPAVAASENTLFRYTPNNPFWSIPASCDWDEWKSFYNQAAPSIPGNNPSAGVW